MTRPNFLIIMADQLRHDWLGYAGATQVDTPNIDALAARSARFSHAFTPSPVCGPARIAIATGLLPHRTGTTNNEKAMLSREVPTYFAQLRNHDYRVELVGRHDLHKPGAPGSVHGTHPRTNAYGFTRAIEVEGACSSAFQAPGHGVTGPYTALLERHGMLEAYSEDYFKRRDNGWYFGGGYDSILPTELHQDVFITDLAVERLNAMANDFPWHLQVSFQTPHDPFDPPAEYGERYRDRAMPPALAPSDDDSAYIAGRQIGERSTGDIEYVRRQYSAKVALLDDQVGRILSALDERGETENTIIVFTSDHGEQLCDHGMISKHTAYDPSWRVPLLVSGPGVTCGDHPALIETSDLGPTLGELAGCQPMAGLDARSFAGVLTDETAEHREHCVCIEDGYRALRTRDHKLIRYDDGSLALFDLNADPDEQSDQAAQAPALVDELNRQLEQRFAASLATP